MPSPPDADRALVADLLAELGRPEAKADLPTALTAVILQRMMASGLEPARILQDLSRAGAPEPVVLRVILAVSAVLAFLNGRGQGTVAFTQEDIIEQLVRGGEERTFAAAVALGFAWNAELPSARA